MHKSCAENLYLHFVLLVLFNNIWSASHGGGVGLVWVCGGSGDSSSKAVEILRFLYRMRCLSWRRCRRRWRRCLCGFESFAFSHFALVSCILRGVGGVRDKVRGGKLFVLFQVPNNLTTKILNFCLNCRQCVLQLCVCV